MQRFSLIIKHLIVCYVPNALLIGGLFVFPFLADNRKKQRRKEAQVKQDFSDFAKLGGGQQGTNIISPQLALATYQFLSTCK